jgi:glycine betaine/proline transport system substrate-binding protein
MARRTRRLALACVAAAVLLVASACGGGNIKNTQTAASGKSCGTFNVAVNPWVGYEADAYVIGNIAKQKLGCTVNYQNVKEQVAWQGMASGTTDTVLENWGHQDLVKKYITQEHVVQDAGWDGVIGHIGWFVPPWLAKAHPDITNWKNLNKYASKFKTSESGGKGQFLDGDPSYVTNDQALVKNLNLDFKVVFSGSETALIQAYRQAEQKHQWVIGYWYTPQWFNQEVPMVVVHLPKYTPGCDANAAKVACDYPTYHLNKLVSKKFADSGSPALTLVKNWQWSNTDQNQVAGYIAKDGMSPTAAANKWIKANPDKVKAWLKGT